MNAQLAFKLGRAFKLGLMYGLGRTYATNPGDAQDAAKWITVNGTHIPVGKNGKLEGKVGKKVESQQSYPKSGKNLIESPPSRIFIVTCKRPEVIPLKLSSSITTMNCEEVRLALRWRYLGRSKQFLSFSMAKGERNLRNFPGTYEKY